MKIKILSLIMCFLLMISACSMLSVAAENNLLIIENPATASKGDKIVVTIKPMSAQTNIGGMRVMLEFDTSRLKYLEGSRTVLDNEISEKDLTPDKSKDGKIYFVYEAQKGITLDSNIVSYQFEVLSNAQDGEAKFNLHLYEMYLDDAGYTSVIAATQSGSFTVVIGATDAKITAVEEKITAIGTVEATDACKTLINEAFSAYNALTTIQKNQVSNYDVLTAAYDTYNRLKSEKEKSENKAQADAFREKYKKVLSLTKDTVKLSNESQIKAASEEWNKIGSADVKGMLTKEKNLLRVLAQRVEELKKIAEDEKAEAALKAEAKELAKQFREYYKGVLSLTEKTVTAEDSMGVSSALSEIENYQFVNTYVQDELKKEKALLEKLRDKIEQIRAEEGAHPERAEVEAFNEKYGWLLALDEKDATADDYITLSVALSYYENLSDEAKALLPGVSDKLNELLAISEELFYKEEEAKVIVETETVEKEVEKEVIKTEIVEVNSTITETVEVPGETQVKTDTKYLTRNIHPMVIWSIIIFAISVSALAAAFIAYFTRKKEAKGEEAL